MAFKTTSSRTIIPLQIPKRGMTNLALGYLPTWYKKNNPSPQTQEAVKSIVYMDVSGSFISYIPWTLGLITAMKDRCNTEKLFVFSTELYQTSMQEVSEGKYKSTGRLPHRWCNRNPPVSKWQVGRNHPKPYR